MKTLIIFPGWGENDKLAPEIKQTKPAGWKVIKISYQKLMPEASVSKFLKNIELLLKNLKVDDFYLLGYSLGGILALEYVIKNPSRVRHLFLVNSEGVRSPSNIIKLGFNFVRSNPFVFTKKIKGVLATVPGVLANPRWNMELMRLAEEGSMEHLAPKVVTPTTILWGDKDKVTPLWQGQRLNQLIPRSKLVILPGLKHDWLFSHPKLFWENILLA